MAKPVIFNKDYPQNSSCLELHQCVTFRRKLQNKRTCMLAFRPIIRKTQTSSALNKPDYAYKNDTKLL